MVGVDETDVDALTVADLMTSQVIGVEATDSLQAAARVMVSKGIRHLPVLEAGRVIAVLSDRDIRLMVTDLVDPQERRAYMESTPVLKHASSPVISAQTSTSVRDAARLFVESRIGCLPVVGQDDALLGIVTQTDLLKWIARMTD
jgi:acetoin utilization protein AcuB